MAAEGFERAVANSLTHCRSGGEWLTAAKTATDRTPGSIDPAAALARFCRARFTDYPLIIPIDAPSCPSPSPSHVVADLGRCPKGGAASLPPGAPRAPVPGLETTLVPIAVLNVRVCRYDASAPSTIVRPPYAMQIAAETNRLPKIPNGASYNCAPTQPPYFFVTFANDTQHVDVWEDGGCGFMTNGLLSASTTTKWRNEMRNYTTSGAAQAPNPR